MTIILHLVIIVVTIELMNDKKPNFGKYRSETVGKGGNDMWIDIVQYWLMASYEFYNLLRDLLTNLFKPAA